MNGLNFQGLSAIAACETNQTIPRVAAGRLEQPTLHSAVCAGDTAALGGLLSANVAVDARDAGGRTALLVGCAGLVESSAASHCHEEDGRPQAARAAAAQRSAVVACVIALIQAGADVNRADHEGRTPLMFALSARAPNVAQALLRAGAEPFARDASGQSTFFYAIAVANSRRAGGDLTLALGAPASEGLAAILRFARAATPEDSTLARAGASTVRSALEQLDILGPAGLPPLARAAVLGDAEACRQLLAVGADPDRAISGADSRLGGMTPREIARGAAQGAFDEFATRNARQFAERTAAELFRSLGVKSLAR